MSVLYGLSAAAFFGTADFFATKSARRVGVLRTLLAVQIFGLVAMIAVVLIKGELPKGSASGWLEMALISVVSFGGVLLLYRAFAIGTLSLVSPIASGFAVVTAGLALAAGERPPGLAVTGALLLMSGVIVVTRSGDAGAASIAGVPEAIGATVGFGIYFWALGELTPELGVYWPVIVTRFVELILAIALIRLRPPLPIPNSELRSALPLFLAAAGLDTAALIAFNLGVDSAFTTTTTALTSLYSAVTMLLAWAILRERLAGTQWAGVGVVMAGVFLVSV
jgi:drug/metabolite transporter (DMT)-like permease